MTTIKDTPYYLFFDVESVGLHGVGFSVGGALYHESGNSLSDFIFTCSPDNLPGDEEDKKWVQENVPILEVTHRSPKKVRDAFWEHYQALKEQFPGLVLVAECPWPVESNFLSACIADDPSRKWDGPYPLIDVSSAMFSFDVDPLKPVERKDLSLVEHDPRSDAHLSAQIFFNL